VGQWLPTTVVLYDLGTGAAVLRVPGLNATAFSLAEDDATRGSFAAAAGYPHNGGLDLRAAMVATRWTRPSSMSTSPRSLRDVY
jgi:hypothetical protein